MNLPPNQTNAIPVLIGPFPQPYHGVTIANEKFVRRFRMRGIAVDCINISPGREKKSLSYHASRVIRTMVGILRILMAPHSPERRYEMSVDGGLGGLYNLVLAAAVRLRAAPLILYHHSTDYIIETRWLVQWLFRIAGPKASHIACSRKMFEMLRDRYGLPDRFFLISNAAWIEPVDVVAYCPTPDCVTVGFLSALNEEKGALRALETFELLKLRGVAAKIRLAGVHVTESVRKAVDVAKQKYGTDVDFLGTIPASDKIAFFASLDYFLFPTLYRHETQSSVTAEAMAEGVPVIAYDHRFVGELIGSDGGLLVPTTSHFAEVAAEWIAGGAGTADRSVRRARTAEHYNKVHAEASGQVDRVVCYLVGERQ